MKELSIVTSILLALVSIYVVCCEKERYILVELNGAEKIDAPEESIESLESDEGYDPKIKPPSWKPNWKPGWKPHQTGRGYDPKIEPTPVPPIAKPPFWKPNLKPDWKQNWKPNWKPESIVKDKGYESVEIEAPEKSIETLESDEGYDPKGEPASWKPNWKPDWKPLQTGRGYDPKIEPTPIPPITKPPFWKPNWKPDWKPNWKPAPGSKNKIYESKKWKANWKPEWKSKVNVGKGYKWLPANYANPDLKALNIGPVPVGPPVLPIVPVGPNPNYYPDYGYGY